MVEWRRRIGEVEGRVAEERSGGAGGRKVEGAERLERRWGGKERVEERVKGAKSRRKARREAGSKRRR